MGVRQAMVEPLSRRDPARVGPYTLLGRLGAGAMGRVYLGRSAAGRLVAVKTIRIELADEDDFRARFAHEVAAARRVSGVFTAAVVEADAQAEVPWLATAYVPAPSLERLVTECGPLPVPAVRWLAAGCAEALGSIHSVGLVHRDLKPSNVLVSLDGPRVIDFGLARAAERVQLTATRAAVGTPSYMSPEQARGPRYATMASDVFSLGSTLLYAATGHPPYRGEAVMEVLVRLATEPPDLSGLADDLADIVIGCLERDPTRRPSPASLLGSLAPYLEVDATPAVLSSLPGTALNLIEEYRQGPHISSPVRSTGTEPSDPSIPVPTPVPVPRERRGGPVLPLSWSGRRVISAVVSLGAVAALVVLGIVLGMSLSDDRSPSGEGRPPAEGAPPPPVSGANDKPGGPPQIIVNQPQGDGATNFVVHGTGWKPGTAVTVRLAGVKVSPDHPVADRKGSFNYAVNQSHEFYAGGLPLGHHRIVVSAPGGAKAEVGFQVVP